MELVTVTLLNESKKVSLLFSWKGKKICVPPAHNRRRRRKIEKSISSKVRHDKNRQLNDSDAGRHKAVICLAKIVVLNFFSLENSQNVSVFVVVSQSFKGKKRGGNRLVIVFLSCFPFLLFPSRNSFFVFVTFYYVIWSCLMFRRRHTNSGWLKGRTDSRYEQLKDQEKTFKNCRQRSLLEENRSQKTTETRRQISPVKREKNFHLSQERRES